MEWTTLDICTYFINNAVGGFIIGILVAVVASLCAGNICFGMFDLNEKKGNKIILVCAVISLFLSILVSLIPTHNNIIDLKISKIKNEAVTKENLDQGVETIERVLEKLEKKYLGE